MDWTGKFKNQDRVMGGQWIHRQGRQKKASMWPWWAAGGKCPSQGREVCLPVKGTGQRDSQSSQAVKRCFSAKQQPAHRLLTLLAPTPPHFLLPFICSAPHFETTDCTCYLLPFPEGPVFPEQKLDLSCEAHDGDHRRPINHSEPFLYG